MHVVVEETAGHSVAARACFEAIDLRETEGERQKTINVRYDAEFIPVGSRKASDNSSFASRVVRFWSVCVSTFVLSYLLSFRSLNRTVPTTIFTPPSALIFLCF